MTRKIYVFREFSEDNFLHSLAQVAKDILQHNEFMVKMYQKYNDILYSQCRGESPMQLALDKPILFAPGPVISRKTPQYTRVPSTPETNSKNNKVPIKKTSFREKQPAINDENDIFPGKENKAFSLLKGCKTLDKYTANDQLSQYSDEKNKMMASSTQLDQRNISYQGRKSFEPRNELMLFRSMPRFIQSSGVVQIETDALFRSEESLNLPILHKSPATAVNTTGGKKLSKDTNFSEDSKTGFSSDFSHPTKTHLTSSFDTKSISSEVLELEKEHLPYKLLKVESPTNASSETASFTINNLESNTLRYYMEQLFTRVQLTEQRMNNFLDSLLNFQNDLQTFNYFLDSVQYFVRDVFINEDRMKDSEHEKNISGLEMESSKLKEKIGSWEMEVDEEIEQWVESFEKIKSWSEAFEEMCNLKPENEHTVYYDHPSNVFESCQVCENNLKTIKKKVEDMIYVADSRIRLFATTAGEFGRIINSFVRCLITIGILKPSPTSML